MLRRTGKKGLGAVALNSNKWYVLRTKRTDLRAGDEFEMNGLRWIAVTNPHGAYLEAGGVKIPIGPPYDADIYTPEVGELTAELIG